MSTGVIFNDLPDIGQLRMENRSDLIRFAYRFILSFEVDEAGINHWLPPLANGLPVPDFLGELHSVALGAAPPAPAPKGNGSILAGIDLASGDIDDVFAAVRHAIEDSAQARVLAVRCERR